MELLIIIVVTIVFFARTADLRNRIDYLEEEIGKLKDGEQIPKEAHKPATLEYKSVTPPAPYISEQQKVEELESEATRIADPYAFKEYPKEKPPEPFVVNKKEETSNRDLEFKFGSKIFTVVGAVAVIFGLGFFLRYAFENNLISETMRVVLGLISGTIFLGFGEYTRRKYPLYGQILTGLGIGAFYLSIYAAFNFYALIGMPLAFVLMIFVTAFGVALAIWNDSMPLAALAQFGGFVTPFLLSNGVYDANILFSYVALLDIGILAIAYFKLWRHLVVLGYVGTAITYLVWYMNYKEEMFSLAVGYATLFFVIFLGILLMHFLKKRAPQDEADLALTTINSAGYFLICYNIFNFAHYDLLGLFTALLAILHIGIGLVVAPDDERAKRFRFFLIGIGLVLSVIAVPIQFEKFWITIAWAAEGLVLTFLGFQMGSKKIRYFAQGIFLLSFLRLLLIDGVQEPDVPWLNSRMLTYLFSIIIMSIASGIYYYYKDQVDGEEKPFLNLLPLLPAFLLFWGITLEINSFFGKFWLGVSWSMIGFLIASISFGVKNLALRVLGLLVFVATFLRLILIESNSNLQTPWVNERTFAFLVAILMGGLMAGLYRAFRDTAAPNEYEFSFSALLLYVYVLVLWVLTSEILKFYPERDYWLPIIWSLGALLGGWASLYLKNVYLQATIIITFIMAAVHLLFKEGSVDITTYTPIINTRVFSFLAVVLAGVLYMNIFNYFKDLFDAPNTKNIKGGFYFVISFLLLFLVSREVLDIFNRQFYLLLPEDQSTKAVSFDNQKRAALSVTWTLYSLIMLVIGIIKKSAWTRIFGLTLLSVTIIKVFLYDTANLDNLYRSISWITLGLILLIAGYLYFRFKSRITEFIKVE